MTNVGLAGFGSAGQGIHAPLMRAAGLTVAAVSTSNADRAAQAREENPGVEVVPDVDALLATPGLDLVVLATPSGAHAAQARQVIEAGLPVVVDKPLATSAPDAHAVVEAAAAAGVPLTVFQNRRFDAEHVTARELVRDGELGDVFRAEIRWERWRPEPKDRWRENAAWQDGGGIMLDLQTHLLDQAVDLFGPVEAVYAEVAAHTTTAEDEAFLACRHASGVRSHLGTTSVAAAPGPRLRLLGRRAAYVLNEFESDLDIYVDLRNQDADHCGWVYAGETRRPVRRRDSSQVDFYRRVAQALTAADSQAAMPVDPRDAVHTLAVIDAARVSAGTGTVARVQTPGA
ncbi:MAG: Gfo/Idh/MocA family protein [Oryzihumus sp.]